jgi:hypothetical protein
MENERNLYLPVIFHFITDKPLRVRVNFDTQTDHNCTYTFCTKYCLDNKNYKYDNILHLTGIQNLHFRSCD